MEEAAFNPSEGQLVSQCLSGRGEAFDALYARHAGAVKAYFLRGGFVASDSDELLREAFLRAFRSLGTFDAARGSLRTWLGAIARDVARRHLHRRVEAENFDGELADEPLAAQDRDPESLEEMKAVAAFVEALPDEMGRLVRLRYVDGRTTHGIAAVTGVPEPTVRIRLKESLAMMESWMRSQGFAKEIGR